MQDREGYRQPVLLCPNCTEPMHRQRLAGAQVDICKACALLWLDWHDGAWGQLGQALRQQGGSVAASEGVASKRAANDWHCPLCATGLRVEWYGLSGAALGDASEKYVAYRCEGCVGAAVPTELILAFSRDVEWRLLQSATTRGLWSRLSSWLAELGKDDKGPN